MKTLQKNYLTHARTVMYLSLAALSAAGQIPEPVLQERIAVTARPSSDSIVLRWAPLNFKVWRAGNEHGYRVERYVLARNGRVLPLPEKEVLKRNIRPLPKNAWQPLVRENRYAAIAAQALFGDRFEIDMKQSDVLTIVNKVKENEQRFAFALFCADMSPAVARASGLWFTDANVRRGEKYLYRVVVNSIDSLRGYVFLSPTDPHLLPKPENLRADFGERLVSLRWEKNPNMHYSAFVIERSTDGTHFKPTSDTPLVTVSPVAQNDSRYEHAVDTLGDLSRTYYYRVKGITPFGEVSPPSAVVSGRPTRNVRQPPYITSVENKQNTSLIVRWAFPKEDEKAIKGFRVERSSEARNAFVVLTRNLLPPNVRTYHDEDAGASNYYKVSAVALDNRIYASHVYYAALVDSIPPVAPIGLKGAIDDNGKVTLSWAANTEPDIYGYRVFKAFGESEEPAQITTAPVSGNHFADKVDLHTLNDAVYYQVMAVDLNQNQSALSQLLKVPLPDKVRPQPPVLLPPDGDADGISIQWLPGASEDITHYAVYRKEQNGDEWKRLALVAANDTLFRYRDDTAPAGKTSIYTVVSVDDAGLESGPAHPVAAARPTMPAERVIWKKPVIHAEDNAITLRWDYTAPASRFRIFRATDHGQPLLLTTVPADQHEFTDTMKPGRYYAYRIMAVFTDGNKSHLSEVLEYQY